MSDDEIKAAFEQVLADAAAADADNMEQFASLMTERMEALLESGIVPVKVITINGHKCVAVPEYIMAAMISALNEFCEFNQAVDYQAELGNASVLIQPLWSSLMIKSLVTKCAFISLALMKDAEKDIVNEWIGGGQ